MLYFSVKILGFSEREFWKFTLKKYVILRDLYIAENGTAETPMMFADDF